MKNDDWKILPAESVERKPRLPRFTLFSLNDILGHYKENIDEVDKNISLAEKYRACNERHTAESICRSQIVFIESAFDFYMHEITRFSFQEIHEKRWPQTEKYRNLLVSMKDLTELMDSENSIELFVSIISRQFSFRQLISNDEFHNQLNLIGLNYKAIAEKSFYKRGDCTKPERKMKKFLTDLYNCRNCIAHQASREPRNAKPISVDVGTVMNYKEDMNKIVYAIDNELRKKSMNPFS